MKITLNDIGKKFNRQWVFKHISHVFPSGSATALIGNNGSGKSTLLQVIDNFQTYSSGSIQYEFQGKELHEEELVGKIALAAPYLDVPDDFSLREMLDFHFGILGLKSGNRIEDLITDCGLQGQENKRVKHFSSGMRQRLKLTMAIYADTPLLLLDEPCSNLDENGIAWYRQLMQEQLGKRSIIIASNQLVEYDFCDTRLSVMEFKPKSAF